MSFDSAVPPAWQTVPLMDVEAVETEFRRSRVRIEAPEELWYVEETSEAHKMCLNLRLVDGEKFHRLYVVDVGYDGLAIASRAKLKAEDLVEVFGNESTGTRVLFKETLEIKNRRKTKVVIGGGVPLTVYGAESLHKKKSWLYKTILDSYFMRHVQST